LTLASPAVDGTNGLSDYLVLAKPAGPRCNLRCAYCYYLPTADMVHSAAPWRMDEAMLESFVRQRLEFSTGPVTHFEWHGGEPTLMGLDFNSAMEAAPRIASALPLKAKPDCRIFARRTGNSSGTPAPL
jgi:sulfatase maturation enzyme AslB (radical SAM superfamily)